MTKNARTSIELDKIDQAILSALRKDGRAPFAKIADDLDVSPGMIRLRYNRLVDAGLVRVVAITNPLQMGYKTMAIIGIRSDGVKLLKIAKKIAALEEVVYLVVVSGRFEIIAEVACRDHADLLNFMTEKLYAIEGVREAESFIHLKIEKEVYF